MRTPLLETDCELHAEPVLRAPALAEKAVFAFQGDCSGCVVAKTTDQTMIGWNVEPRISGADVQRIVARVWSELANVNTGVAVAEVGLVRSSTGAVGHHRLILGADLEISPVVNRVGTGHADPHRLEQSVAADRFDAWRHLIQIP